MFVYDDGIEKRDTSKIPYKHTQVIYTNTLSRTFSDALICTYVLGKVDKDKKPFVSTLFIAIVSKEIASI
jgi:hypothetical protein